MSDCVLKFVSLVLATAYNAYINVIYLLLGLHLHA